MDFIFILAQGLGMALLLLAIFAIIFVIIEYFSELLLTLKSIDNSLRLSKGKKNKGGEIKK